ncbi:MAG: hypothetical protein ACHQPH_00710 [Reyranellales bacterium]
MTQWTARFQRAHELSEASKAPRPFLGGANEARLHRILLHVTDGALKMVFVSHVAIEEVVVPEGAGPADQCVCLVGRKRFPAVEDRSQTMPLQQLDHDVDVVGHDASGEEPVALIVEVQQRGFDLLGDVFAFEPAGTEAGIEFPIDPCRRIISKAKRFDHMPGQAIGQPKRHELDGFG